MAKKEIFVGRKPELDRFKEVLADPAGQAVVVVGHRGMGKTWLINEMARITGDAKCRSSWFEVTPEDSPDRIMEWMMDRAFDTAQVKKRSFDDTVECREKWRAFLNMFKLGDLLMSLRRGQQRNTREQFLERLRLISRRMPDERRAIFIIDPEKYMHAYSDQIWAIVVRNLPHKIKVIFAQRTEDVLVKSETFRRLDNVVRIPEDWLDALETQAVDELLDLRSHEAIYTITQLREALSRYEGHPYALQAALDLIKEGTKLEDLPADPVGIAEEQWKQVCKRGADAILLFEAYAFLEVAVPDDVVEVVSGLETATRKSLLVDEFLSGLMRNKAEGRRIYHAILGDYIQKQIEEKGFIRGDIDNNIKRLLISERSGEFVQLLDKILSILENRIRKEKSVNLVNDYLSLSKAFAEAQPEGSVQKTYRYQSVGRVLRELERYEDSKKFYIQGALEYKKQVHTRDDEFWRSESLFQVGWCYEHAESWQEAAAYYRKAHSELSRSSVVWKALLEAELLRCAATCLQKALENATEALGMTALNALVEETFRNTLDRFRNELKEDCWTCKEILSEIAKACLIRKQNDSVCQGSQKRDGQLTESDECRCSNGGVLFLCNPHDMYVADKIREVFSSRGMQTERVPTRYFAQNKKSLVQLGKWDFIICLGGPVSDDGLFNWKFEVFGEYPDFHCLLERSVGYFGCWYSRYERSKAILLAGVGKYRTFLGIQDITEKELLDKLLNESLPYGRVFGKQYDWR